MRLRFGGLNFGRAYFFIISFFWGGGGWGAYYQNFTVCHCTETMYCCLLPNMERIEMDSNSKKCGHFSKSGNVS